MKTVAFVPARSGSKGYPHKNIAKICQKTLLEIAIQVANNTDCIDDVFISTDSSEYEKIGLDAGAKSFGLRSISLSNDTAKSVDVALDFLENLDKKYDFLVLLQPTSPVRSPENISNMIGILKDNDADSIVSVSSVLEPHPYKMKRISDDGLLFPLIDNTTSEQTRQSLPPVYALNGAIYIIKIKALLFEKTFFPKKTLPYIMDENYNIDTEEDLIFLKIMHELGKVKIWSLDN